MKGIKNLLLSALSVLFISPTVFAADKVAYGQPTAQTIYTMNGTSGFVFNRLKAVSKVNSQGYDMLIVDSSSALSSNQMSQLENYLDKGGVVVIDAKAGTATAQGVAKSITNFSLSSEAIMITKSNQSQGGYNVTPISSNAQSNANATLSSSKIATTSGNPQVSNTINDVFGL